MGNNISSNTIKNVKIETIKIKKVLNAHSNIIYKMSFFPSGNIISVSKDNSIKIWDTDFNLIQEINEEENNSKEGITYVLIENENNYITTSNAKNLKFWLKENNIFKCIEKIEKAHDNCINHINLICKEKIITCSYDLIIKIWNKIKNKNYHQCITYIKIRGTVFSSLILNDKNLLVISGDIGTIFFNKETYQKNKVFKKALCHFPNALKRLNNNTIITGGEYKNILFIIDINKNEIIKEVYNNFLCYGIFIMDYKGLFLTSGLSSYINVFNIKDYKCEKILDLKEEKIFGFLQLKNNLLLSYSNNFTIWNLSLK